MLSKQCLRESFSRFADDLTQVLLTYVTIDDKMRLQSVCRRWSRVILGSQWDLNVYYPQDVIGFERLVSKCMNCEEMDVKTEIFMTEILDTIGRCCPHLTAINLVFPSEEVGPGDLEGVKRFFMRYSSQLTAFRCEVNEDRQLMKLIKRRIKKCPNLRELHVTCRSKIKTLSMLVKHNGVEVVVKNLQKLSLYYRPSDLKRFDLIVRNYAHSLKTIRLTIDDDCDPQSMYQLMYGLSHMYELVDVEIRCSRHVRHDIVVNGLHYIYDCTPQLRRLCLHFHRYVCPTSDELLEIIGVKFWHLRRLEIHGLLSTNMLLNMEYLYACTGLTHLSIRTHVTTDNVLHYCYYPLFNDCGQRLPNLRCLSLGNIEITSCFKNSVIRLQKLQTIDIQSTSDCIDQQFVNDLIQNCPKIVQIIANDQKIIC